ncbi:MAG: phage holin family protein [Saprospiraceae bacterium]
MKDVDYLMESMGETTAYVQQYIEQKIEVTKLEAAEKSAMVISELVTGIMLVMIGTIVILLGIITIGLFLAQWLDSYPIAFLSLTIFFAIIGIILWIFRRTLITNPVVGAVVNRFFSK